MVGVVGGAQPPLPPADDREPDAVPSGTVPGARAGTLQGGTSEPGPGVHTTGVTGTGVTGAGAAEATLDLAGLSGPAVEIPIPTAVTGLPEGAFADVSGAALGLPAAGPRAVTTTGGFRTRMRPRTPLAPEHGSRLLSHAQRLGEVGWSEWDLTTGETSWSDHMYVIFGRDTGQGPIDLHDLPRHAEPSDRQALHGLVARVTQGVRPVHAEFRIRRGGGVRTLRAVLEPSTSGVHGVVQDITGRRQAERIIAEARRQLLDAREKATEERHVTVALREAVLPEPGAVIDLPYARVAVRYVPAGKTSSLGGDWYEAAPLPDGRMFLAVGDVSGHGLPAIAEMAQLRHALLGLTMTGASPGMLLSWLNTLVLNRFGDTTATVVCGHFDPETRLFTWAQAGHPAPILVRRGGARRLSAPRGIVLGASPDSRYSVADIRLEPGDLLLMFTDGLVERRTRDIEEGLSLIVRAAGAIAGDGDFDASLDRLVEAIGGPNPEDDTCLLAVGVTGEDRHLARGSTTR